MEKIIELREVCKSDSFNSFYNIYVEYQKELKANSEGTWDIQTYDDVTNNIKKTWNFNKRSFLIYYGNNVAGLIVFQNVYWENIMYIEDIYIRPNFRRKGLGTKVLRNITELCNENTSIFLFILKKNNLGHQFWKNASHKLGWTETFDPRCSVDSEEDDDELRKVCVKKIYRRN